MYPGRSWPLFIVGAARPESRHNPDGDRFLFVVGSAPPKCRHDPGRNWPLFVVGFAPPDSRHDPDGDRFLFDVGSARLESRHDQSALHGPRPHVHVRLPAVPPTATHGVPRGSQRTA